MTTISDRLKRIEELEAWSKGLTVTRGNDVRWLVARVRALEKVREAAAAVQHDHEYQTLEQYYESAWETLKQALKECEDQQ